MSDKDDAANMFDSLTSWMADADSMKLDELRELRRAMGHDVGLSEQTFLALLKDFRSRLPHSAHAELPITGIVMEGQKRGLNAAALADLVGLSVVLVTKLDRRLVTFSSIPKRLLNDLADAIGSTLGNLEAYLQQPQMSAAGARFRANESPRTPEQQDFYAAVRSDMSIGEERRTALLALEYSED
jgi:hypothetical protein